MKNLKTLTAIAAVMLAGLAAPNAAADFTCTGTDLGSLPTQTGLQNTADHGAYLITVPGSITPVDRTMTIIEAAASEKVKVSIWAYSAGTCDEDQSNGYPIVGNAVDRLNPDLPGQESFTLKGSTADLVYRVLIEDNDSGDSDPSEEFRLSVA